MTNDTIAALATPPGSGGIGIIRVSGSQARPIVSRLFGTTRKGPDPDRTLESHRLIHGYIFDAASGTPIDEVMVVAMHAPRSYTAEDVVEIQAHAGSMVMGTLLDQVIRSGARIADPGEFTKRAFLNGRIDLTQAEAVMDIINARSAISLKLAASQSLGSLGDAIAGTRRQLIDFLALIEAAIDFPDDAQEFVPQDQGLRAITQALETCRSFLRHYTDAHFLRDGIKLAICGATNVGKSSLMNRLIARERSIVTAQPGTTRDLIEESITIQGIPFLITDTAGMRPTDDLVEKIGIEKAKKNIRESDLVLYMKEAGSTVTQAEISAIIPPDKKVILVINKTDLISGNEPETIPQALDHIPVVRISALKDQGIDTLRKQITDMAVGSMDTFSTVVPNLRHKLALEQAADHLETARAGFSQTPEPETLAIDIRSAAELLGQITGDTAGIDILDTIFSKFCIGK
ncbi:MAG: tRNA uridine-5-carboxymethylaminomethyl(34) synthesis GTPase MnmE [Pseudomonadota bacterium]